MKFDLETNKMTNEENPALDMCVRAQQVAQGEINLRRERIKNFEKEITKTLVEIALYGHEVNQFQATIDLLKAALV
jgi:hypothetical protein